MGEGKTEAALYLADTAAAPQARGFPYGPTHPGDQQPAGKAKAFLGPATQASASAPVATRARNPVGRVRATPPGRELRPSRGLRRGRRDLGRWWPQSGSATESAGSFPFSVGTVDQALIGCWPPGTSRPPLRPGAPGGHLTRSAYDTYTSGLIDSLLGGWQPWAAPLSSFRRRPGSTKAQRRRSKGPPRRPTPLPSADYPRVTWISTPAPGHHPGASYAP